MGENMSASLHIGLDGSRLAKAAYTGTEHYTWQIFNHMFRVAPHHRYTVYAPQKPTLPLDTGYAHVTWRIIPFPRLWTQLRLSLEFATRPQPDVLFVPSHTVPLIHPKATVVTVHDLGFRSHPEYYTTSERLFQEFALWQATRSARRLIAISNTTRSDILEHARIPSNRVQTIYHGIDRDQFHPQRIGELPSNEQRAASPYIYTVGRLEAKKNTPLLIRAFRILAERYHLPHHLVLAGKPGTHGYSEVQQALAELPAEIRNRVHCIGYVPDDAHASWLRHAAAFVFPSGFEGFGMPLLEAMASEIPIIASRSSSIPEIVADAGILVNPTRAEAIAEGIAAVLTDKHQAQVLITKGRKRERQFSWERAARETIGVIEAVRKELINEKRT